MSQSLLAPSFHRSEIFGFLAGLGTTFAARARLAGHASSSFCGWNEPENGSDNGCFPDLMGVLRIVNFV